MKLDGRFWSVLGFLALVGCEPDRTVSEYTYLLKEHTGSHQYAMVDGREVPMTFSDRSDRAALNSLRALKWNVLYNTGRKNPITLRGHFDESTGLMELLGWSIRVPFVASDVADETEIPHEITLVPRTRLLRSDFEVSASFDPYSEDFNPRDHESRHEPEAVREVGVSEMGTEHGSAGC